MTTLEVAQMRRALESEKKFMRKWEDERERREKIRAERRAAQGLAPFTLPDKRNLSSQSSNAHYLSQKLKIEETPYDEKPGRIALKSSPGLREGSATMKQSYSMNDMLYFGVSCEGQGRDAYLKERYKIDEQDKQTIVYGGTRICPTERASQAIGWTVKKKLSNKSGLSYISI